MDRWEHNSNSHSPHLLNPPGRADHDGGHLFLQALLLLLHGDASKEVAHLDVAESDAEALELVANLRGAYTRMLVRV